MLRIMEEMGLDTAVAQRPTILKLNHTHEAIARWLIENPTLSLGACAKHFSYTPAWLSCIIHSDAFQAKLQQLQTEADACTVLDVPARLRGVAAAALDGLAHQVDLALDPARANGTLDRQFLRDTAELTLRSLGYGAAKTPSAPAGSTHFHNHNHAHMTVDPATLANARTRLLENNVQKADELPAGGERFLSPVQRHEPTVSPQGTPEGTAEARSDISGQSGGASS